MTSAGDDAGQVDAQPCLGGQDHVWALKGIHLSVERGSELEEQCGRCGTLSYVSQPGSRRR